MSKTLIGYLIECDNDQLKDIYASLGNWEWPDSLPMDFKPVWWHGIPRLPSLTDGDVLERKYGFMGPVRDYIEVRVPRRDLDAYERNIRALDPSVGCQVA